MSQPTREEVEAFITALNYGMKVQHKPEFLIALAEGWLTKDDAIKSNEEFDKSTKDAEIYGKGFGTVDSTGRYKRLDPVRVTLNYLLNKEDLI